MNNESTCTNELLLLQYAFEFRYYAEILSLWWHSLERLCELINWYKLLCQSSYLRKNNGKGIFCMKLSDFTMQVIRFYELFLLIYMCLMGFNSVLDETVSSWKCDEGNYFLEYMQRQFSSCFVLNVHRYSWRKLTFGRNCISKLTVMFSLF